MASKRYKRDPLTVNLTEAKEKAFTDWLVDEIQHAEFARAPIISEYGELDYLHHLYEQGRRQQSELRWKGAADLNSWIITEKVDSLRARIVDTIFTDTVFTVEGWGEDGPKAPFVEEFHQWKVEDERLQQYLSKAIHNSLIEGTGILEVIDRHDCRMVRKPQRLMPQRADDGSVLLNDKNQPEAATDEAGMPVPAEQGQPSIDALVSTYETIRKGPGYRVLRLRDFLFLPGHATDKAELFGYAKRCWKRVPELQALDDKGIYCHVDQLSETSDRDHTTPSLEREGQTVAEQNGRTAEKELWEVLVLHDLDEDGIEEWYLATVSVQHRVLLRLQTDDLGMPRYLDLTPFPRTDSLYGYSFAGHKLSSIHEEHAAVRNMRADRSTLVTNAPILRMVGGLWEPKEQPFGPGAIIDVRQKDEISPFTVPDVPASVIQQESVLLQASERLSGLNDAAVGIQTQEKRTRGEVEIVSAAGAIRVSEVVKNVQEGLEPLFLLRNEIWIRTLATQPEGLEPPETVMRSLEARSLKHEQFNGKFTADLLRGNFRGKPRNSVETADKVRRLQMFNGSIQALTGMSQFNPVFAMILQHPQVAKSLLEQWARLYNVPDRSVFLQAANEAMQKMAEQAQQQAMAEQMINGALTGQPQGMLPEQAGGGPMDGLPPELMQLLQAGAPPGVM